MGMSAEQRQHDIAALLREVVNQDVASLAGHFGVSEVTIRRDLSVMAKRGIITRGRGMAISLISRAGETPIILRSVQNAPVKEALAAAASALVNDGDTIALDSGTTTAAVARALIGRKLTVMPFSISAIETLCVENGPAVVLPGGQVRPVEGSIYGPLAELSISRLRFDVAFLGVCAIDPNGDVMANSIEDAAVKRAIIANSDRVIIVSESWKFSQRGTAFVTNLADVDLVVTDDLVAEAPRGLMNQLSMEVELVSVT